MLLINNADLAVYRYSIRACGGFVTLASWIAYETQHLDRTDEREAQEAASVATQCRNVWL